MSDGTISKSGVTLITDFKRDYRITASQTLVQGEMAALVSGRVRPMDDAAGYLPIGIIDGPSEKQALQTGGTAADSTDPGAQTRGGIVMHDVTVTGVSAVTDIGTEVYMTDGNTLTLTRPADDAVPVGVICWKQDGTTNTTCDVYIYSLPEHALKVGQAYTMCLGVFRGGDFTAGYVVGSASSGIRMAGRGKIIDFKGFVAAVPTNDTKETAISLKINDTAVTSGLIDWDASETQTHGAVIAGSSAVPSAANVFSDGDLLQLVCAGGSPPTDGAVAIYITIQPLLGA